MITPNKRYKLKYETGILVELPSILEDSIILFLKAIGNIIRIRMPNIKPNLKNIWTEKILVAINMVIKNVQAFPNLLNLFFVSLLNRYKTNTAPKAVIHNKNFWNGVP